jgi:heme exporter protein C
VPIVHYSVEWWNSLHQGPTVSRIGKPSIAPSMLWPLLAMSVGCMALFAWAVLRRVQNELLLRERRSSWVKAWLREREAAGHV